MTLDQVALPISEVGETIFFCEEEKKNYTHTLVCFSQQFFFLLTKNLGFFSNENSTSFLFFGDALSHQMKVSLKSLCIILSCSR